MVTALIGVEEPLRGIRKVAAKRLTQAWQAPSFPLIIDVDMNALLSQHVSGSGITVTDRLLQLVARALIEHPGVNAHFQDDVITRFETVNLGLAVGTPQGLTVPVIHGVEKLTVDQISERRRDLVERARVGALQMADIDGGTFSVSNLGMMGIRQFTSILNPPQVAILAVGASQRRVVEAGSGLAVRPMSTLTLTCDHRALDGVMGAEFLATLKTLIETDRDAGN
jgi:pyruvate dehydrogenase E2 component (dihydrolipoamide acetyltransferase)